MNFKKIINKYLACFIIFTFLFIGVGCSNQTNDDTIKKNVKVQTQNSQEIKKKSVEKEKQEALAKFKLKEAKVSRVVDGDTIELSDGSKVRFIGVNTPESTTRHEPYGKEASNYTKDKLTGKTVYLEKDVSETDKYGRLLRYVWLDIPKDINDSEIKSKMFNAILAIRGYAQQSTYPPDVKYKDYFGKYAKESREKRVGLWSINPNGTTKGDNNKSLKSSNTNSNNNRNSNGNKRSNTNSNSNKKSNANSNNNRRTNSNKKSNINVTNNSNASVTNNEVIITMQGKKYHRPGCSTIKQVKDKISKQEAKDRGYGPCGRCHP